MDMASSVPDNDILKDDSFSEKVILEQEVMSENVALPDRTLDLIESSIKRDYVNKSPSEMDIAVPTADSNNVKGTGFISEDSNSMEFFSLSEAMDAVKKFQFHTNSKFAIYKKMKDFGIPELSIAGHYILFQGGKGAKALKFTGIPFVLIGSQVLDCVHGVNHKLWRKKKIKEEAGKVYKKRLPSIKIGCPAKISMIDVIFFTDKQFKAEANTERRKRTIVGKIKEQWNNGEIDESRIERKVIVTFPHTEEHVGHLIGEHAEIEHQVERRRRKKRKKEDQLDYNYEIPLNEHLLPSDDTICHKNHNDNITVDNDSCSLHSNDCQLLSIDCQSTSNENILIQNNSDSKVDLCQNLLDQIRLLTCLLNDSNTLDWVVNKMYSILEFALSSCSNKHDISMPLFPSDMDDHTTNSNITNPKLSFCQNLSDQIRSIIYLIDDDIVFEQLAGKFNLILEFVASNCSHEVEVIDERSRDTSHVDADIHAVEIIISDESPNYINSQFLNEDNIIESKDQIEENIYNFNEDKTKIHHLMNALGAEVDNSQTNICNQNLPLEDDQTINYSVIFNKNDTDAVQEEINAIDNVVCDVVVENKISNEQHVFGIF